MSKKYEKKMSEVETMVQTILKSMAKEEKHGVKKVNNSFSIEATNQSLLQPPTNYNHKKK